MDQQLLEEIKNMSVSELDIELDGEKLQKILFSLPAKISALNMEFFEKKREMRGRQRVLQLLESSIMLGLDSAIYKNEAMRSAGVKIDPKYRKAKEDVDIAELAVEELEQRIWVYRHLESNVKAVTDLRTQELRTLRG